MPSLIISKDSHFYNLVAIDGKTNIGRGRSNDLVLEAAGVSRVHARIDKNGDHFYLIDGGSTNGTFVQSRRVQRHRLTHGTSFRIDEYLLTFVDDPLADETSGKKAPALPTGTTSHKPAKTSWKMPAVHRKNAVQQKVGRFLQMIEELHDASFEADPGTLVLDALLDMTSAGQGGIALLKKNGNFHFTHLRGFGPGSAPPTITLTLLEKILTPENDRQFDQESELYAPLKANEQMIGCIYLACDVPVNLFSNIDRDLVCAAADHVAGTLISEGEPKGGGNREADRFARTLAAEGIIARSPNTIKVFQNAHTIARYKVAVLIYGETGTGKEVIANYIHNHSGRTGDFIACNCSAITDSMFESELFGHEKGAFTGATERKLGIMELADGGTLFLDEIGDMPQQLQAKLLRAIQEQEVWRVGGRAPVKIDVRIISATHKDIKHKRKKLNFRDDLYYRLAKVEITSPSLRERIEDIGPLCHMLLQNFSKQHFGGQKVYSLSPKVVHLLNAHDWPGNIRELDNMLSSIAMLCDGTTIEPRHFKGLLDVFDTSSAPAAVTHTDAAGSLLPLAAVEHRHLQEALKQTSGNKSAAAKLLQIDRNRLNRLLKKHNTR